jgi:hypothetical protein
MSRNQIRVEDLPLRQFNCPLMLFNLTGLTLDCDETHNTA